jgi:hypothetical protein
MFDLRGIIHRVAAVVMVLASLYHVYYLLVVPRGKQLLRDILPVRQDLTDAIGVLKYNLGFSKTKPSFARFSYAEKAEYWALIWGTIVMTLTGIILWFENTFLGILTKTGWDISRTVHYYEAWLATLSILVWHFYFVIFNPDAYPVNLAFLKGTITEEEMEEELLVRVVARLAAEGRPREVMQNAVLPDQLPHREVVCRVVIDGVRDGQLDQGRKRHKKKGPQDY